MYKIKRFFYMSAVMLSFFILSGCSNLDVGFEKNSIFHSSQIDEKLENSVVNVYLDKSTNANDKYRLVINGEDTELDLYYDVITRFEINKEKTTIELLKNNTKVMDLHIVLASSKNYFLIVKIDKNSKLPVIEKINKHKINKGTKATPIFASEEIVKKDEVKQIKKIKKQKREEKKEFVAKKNIGIKKSKKEVTTENSVELEKKVKASNIKTKDVQKSSKVTSNKSLQERYDAGETIFYYDPDDGE